MKNNRLLSSLLLVSVATSLFAGILSISRERYERSEAVVTYKTVYLSIPGPDAEHRGQVTKLDESDPIIWDQDEDLYVYTFQGSLPGYPMSKIDDQLYGCTLDSSAVDYIFTSCIGVNTYRSHRDGGSPYKYNQISNTKNLLTLSHYNVSNRGDAGGDLTPYSVTTAEAFAKTFLAVVGDGTCDREAGNTTLAKLQAVWGEMNTLYTSLDDGNKEALHDASIEGSDPINKFAALYNYIYWKYDSSVGAKFINRVIVSVAGVVKNPVVIDNNSGDNTNIIITISIGATSIAIVGLYFFIKKKKEDK